MKWKNAPTERFLRKGDFLQKTNLDDFEHYWSNDVPATNDLLCGQIIPYCFSLVLGPFPGSPYEETKDYSQYIKHDDLRWMGPRLEDYLNQVIEYPFDTFKGQLRTFKSLVREEEYKT